MSAHDTRASGNGTEDGFGEFFRSYTKTWIHAVATAGLTAFGTLTFVHRWFAVLALAAYVVPPIVLYARRASGGESGAGASSVEHEDGIDAAEQRGAADARHSSETRGGESSAQRAPTPGQKSKPAETTVPEKPEDRRTQTADRSEAAVDGEKRSERSEPESVGESRDPSDGDRRPSPRDADESDPAPDHDPDQSRADRPGGWHPVDTPTDETLLDGTVVDGSGAYAVGTCGIVLERVGGEEPSIVLADGPGANANDLHGVDATADGTVVWVAGDNGSVGRIDVETGRHTDYSAPNDLTDNLSGIAVGGTAGEETILLINGSGEVLRGRYDGDAEMPAWDDPVKPGSGSSCSGVDLVDPSTGYCCDTSNGVFETTDGGRSFDRIGLESADGTLVALAALERGDCQVGADDGVVHRYDGPSWTPERVGEGSLAGLDRHGEQTVACDEETIYERATSTADWEQIELETEGALLGVSIGTTGGVAVGEDGTIVQRR